jgi:hypothetical protein
VRVYIDAKHSESQDDTLSYSDDIKAQINKRRYLAGQFPTEEHIMVITTNKRAQRPGGGSHTATTLLCCPGPGGSDGGGGDGKDAANEDPAIDQRTCLITSTDDSLAWAMGPTFARFLV